MRHCGAFSRGEVPPSMGRFPSGAGSAPPPILRYDRGRMWSQESFLAAWNFAAEAHVGQTVPGSERAYIKSCG